MKAAEEFQSILAAYQEELCALDRNLRPGDGVFGFGRVPGDDSCHDRFDGRVSELAAYWARPESGREEAAELARLLLSCDQELSLPVYAQGMLVAIQRHALCLIPRMTGSEARKTRQRYEKQYPFYRRFPIQKELLRALKNAEAGE